MSPTTYEKHERLLKTIAYTWLLLRRKVKSALVEMHHDLTIEQALALLILQKQDGLTLSALAEGTARDRTTISRLVDGLERVNLVVRVPGRSDKRQTLVYLTRIGREQIRRTAPLMHDFSKSVFTGVSEEQIDMCQAVLERAQSSLEQSAVSLG